MQMVASLGLFRKLLWESRDVLVARNLQVVVAWLLIRLSACVEAGIFTAPTLISIQNNSNTSTTAVKLWMVEIEEQQSFGYCPGVRQLVLLSDNDPEQLGMANSWMKDHNLSSYFSFCWFAINQILCNYAHCFAFAHVQKHCITVYTSYATKTGIIGRFLGPRGPLRVIPLVHPSTRPSPAKFLF